MTLEQQGAYINLLARQWSDPLCSLPDDDQALAMLSEMGQGWLANGCRLVRDCFPPHPNQSGRIANARLLELRKERDEWIEKSRQGGLKSAKAKRLQQSKGGTTTVGTKRQPIANSPSPSSSPSPIDPPIGPPGDENENDEDEKQPTPDEKAFKAFWGVVPNQKAKQAAWRAYMKARKRIGKERSIKPAEAREVLLEAMTAYRESAEAKGEFCPHPSTWLNAGRYDDDRATWEDSGTSGGTMPTYDQLFPGKTNED